MDRLLRLEVAAVAEQPAAGLQDLARWLVMAKLVGLIEAYPPGSSLGSLFVRCCQ